MPTPLAARRNRTTLFSPLRISGCKIWLSADNISGIAGGGAVTTWTNRATPGTNDATQSTAAAKPTLQTSVINGLPVVRFDGTDDTMSCGDILRSVGTQGVTFVGVIRPTTVDATYRMPFRVTQDAIREGYDFFNQTAEGWQLQRWIDGAWEQGRSAAVLTVNVTIIVVGGWDGADLGLFTNGASIGSATGGADANITDAAGTVRLGDTTWAGDIAEFVAYDRYLASSERASITLYLARKYNVAVTI